MKKIIFAFAALLLMAACTQNKPTQAVENQTITKENSVVIFFKYSLPKITE